MVVQLMAQIGGEIDVMSLPGKGTTFWAHFPVRLKVDSPKTQSSAREPRLSPEETVNKVVWIRKSHEPA